MPRVGFLPFLGIAVLGSMASAAEVTLNASAVAPRVMPVRVIGGSEFGTFSFPSLGAALAMVGAGAVVRGPAQADLVLGGGTFQQTQLLVDGVRLFDPQTAHHLLNLPIGAEDIQRVEIFTGAAAAPLGAGAYGGAINIALAPTPGRHYAGFSVGSFGTSRARLDVPFGAAHAAITSYHTDGFRSGSDAQITDVLLRSDGLTVGYTDRAFGARDYYAASPDEYERTRTAFAVGRRSVALGGGVHLDIRGSARTSEDFYTTNRIDPRRYANEHTSGSGEVMMTLGGGSSASDGWEIGCSGATWALESRGYSTAMPAYHGMGRRTDYAAAAFVQARRRVHSWLEMSGTLRADWYSRFDLHWSPAAAVGVFPWSGSRLRIAAGRVHRIPSYTELYYWDPAHETSAALKVEHTTVYDAGFEWETGPLRWRAAGSRYENAQLLDWMRLAGAGTPWRVANIAEAVVSVGECTVEWPGRAWISAQAMRRDLTVPDGMETKYIGRYRPYSAVCGVFFPPVYGLEIALFHRYAGDGIGGFVIGAASVRWRHGSWTIHAAMDNLYDQIVEEVPGVPLPGRGFSSGVSVWF